MKKDFQIKKVIQRPIFFFFFWNFPKSCSPGFWDLSSVKTQKISDVRQIYILTSLFNFYEYLKNNNKGISSFSHQKWLQINYYRLQIIWSMDMFLINMNHEKKKKKDLSTMRPLSSKVCGHSGENKNTGVNIWFIIVILGCISLFNRLRREKAEQYDIWIQSRQIC